MLYTAYIGKDVPRVALTSILATDFIKHRWNWAKPILVSPPEIDDKDAALFLKKNKEKCNSSQNGCEYLDRFCR